LVIPQFYVGRQLQFVAGTVNYSNVEQGTFQWQQIGNFAKNWWYKYKTAIWANFLFLTEQSGSCTHVNINQEDQFPQTGFSRCVKGHQEVL